MAEENILFCYMLTDAWGLRLAKVTVFKDGKVQYKDGKRKESCCKLNEPSLKQIKEILKQHAVIFEYTSSEIEFPNILDGVMNFFTFATQGRRECRTDGFQYWRSAKSERTFSRRIYAHKRKKYIESRCRSGKSNKCSENI